MEDRELPAGWASAQVGEVCRLLNGRAYSKSELLDSGKYRVLRVGNLFTNPHWYHSDLELDDDKYSQAGDLLYAWSASFGPHVWEGERVIYHYHIWKVKHDDDLVHRDFLKVFFQWDTNRIKQQQGSGSTMLHVTKKSMEERAIPVPPTAEQRRIAAKLDTTLAAVESCRQRLDGVAELLKRFRQAVLAAATSGELTREWREERGLSTDSWAQASIIELADQVFDGPFGSNLKSEDYTSDGFRVVRLENISHLRFLEEKRTFVPPEKFALLQKHVLFEDDILFSSFVDEEVRTCLLPPALSGVSINKADCFCVRVNRNLCLPGFVVSVLSCRSTFKSLDGLVHGATRPRINLKQLKSLSISLPTLEEQIEILCRQEQLFTLADQLEARLSSARKVVDRLTPVLLAKAFRGELVPQDPSDEPASVLLDRLRAARQAEAAAGKPSRRGRKKAAAHPDQASLGLESKADAVASDPLPPDQLAQLLQECGPLSEKALLAASELEPGRFLRQLQLELQAGTICEDLEEGERVLVAC